MATTNDIYDKNWAPSLENPNEIVQGIEDIAQCLTVIVLTGKGSVPFDPEFGCDILRWVDQPINIALPSIVKEVADAVATYEKRAIIVRITPEINQDQGGAHLTVTLVWKTAYSQDQNLVIPVQ